MTDNGTGFKSSIWGGDLIKELEYHYNGIIWAIVWDPNEAIDIGEWWRWSVREVLLDIRHRSNETSTYLLFKQMGNVEANCGDKYFDVTVCNLPLIYKARKIN